jgi:hypothetical protein
VDEVERGEIASFVSELPEHKQLTAVMSQVSKERWRTVEEYDKLSGALMGLGSRVEERAREELEGIADDIASEEGFDDRGRPETHTLIARVATQPLKPYEEYWDEETKTGFSRSYLEEKLRAELRNRYDEKLDEVQARVEELEGEIHRRKAEALDLLNEVRTPSRVRE